MITLFLYYFFRELLKIRDYLFVERWNVVVGIDFGTKGSFINGVLFKGRGALNIVSGNDEGVGAYEV